MANVTGVLSTDKLIDMRPSHIAVALYLGIGPGQRPIDVVILSDKEMVMHGVKRTASHRKSLYFST